MQLKLQLASPSASASASCDVFEVQPVLVKKQPKFPTRERHMAIRRKKSSTLVFTNTPSCGCSDKQHGERLGLTKRAPLIKSTLFATSRGVINLQYTYAGCTQPALGRDSLTWLILLLPLPLYN
ncbi:hypothetical protein ACLKA7_015999 [Drosophila subpalustris]